MDVRGALKEQYHAGLAMLAMCVERCPADLWAEPNPPSSHHADTDWERPFWRIAFHNIYFTHLYLGQGEDSFQPPPPDAAVQHSEDFERMWRAPWDLEPYELAKETEPCTPDEILEYLTFVDGLVDSTVDGLDLDRADSGFSWYKNISKLSHQLMNLRHLQGHVGQLSELLMFRGIDIDWTSRSRGLER